MDGWCHHGFFSTPVGETLDIAGYTDRYPRWGATWWCFDLPPGWQNWTAASLAEVCTFQWAASHRATMEDVSRLGLDCLRLRFEDLVSSTASRRESLTALATWLGVDADRFARVASRDMPVVMPTLPPRPGRWRDRRSELATVADDAGMRSLATELGYDDPGSWR